MLIELNGQSKELSALPENSVLLSVIAALGMQADRIAVELNGEITRRASWREIPLKTGDRLEIVHFVGGGSTTSEP